MNKVILIGHLAADPDFATTQSGISRCTLRLAVQRRFANPSGVRESDFFNVICWRNTADFAARYFEKGRRIAVEGSLQTRTYDAQDGSKRYVTEVIADNVEFCDRAPENQRSYPQDYSQPQAPARNQQMNMRDMPRQDGFVEVDDDELPF